MTRRFGFLLVLLILILSVIINTGTAQDFGSNWTGQYYNCNNFACPVFNTRVDPAINFLWGAGSPIAGMNADNFSVRWTGIQNFAQGGDYRFTTTFDDSIRVFLDNVVIIDSPSPQALSVTVPVTAGAHTIIVEFNETTGDAFIQFQWGLVSAAGPTATPGPSPTPGPTNTPVPTGLPPIPAGAITGTVVRAAVLNVRDAPSLGGGVINRVLRGQTYAIVGRNPQATWFLLQLSGMQGWVWGYYLYINGNEYTPPVTSAGNTLGLAGAPDYGVVGQSVATLKLRAAPTVASAQTGKVTWGAFVPVIGRTADGYWWKIVWKNTIGWVYSPYMKVFQGNLNNVPIEG